MNYIKLKQYEDPASIYASERADYTDEDWQYQWERDYDQKFAELIINECIAQCNSVSKLEHQGYVVSECIKRIKTHFGIE
jgi:hypothetical protein